MKPPVAILMLDRAELLDLIRQAVREEGLARGSESTHFEAGRATEVLRDGGV